jgi:hypothetical protein
MKKANNRQISLKLRPGGPEDGKEMSGRATPECDGET